MRKFPLNRKILHLTFAVMCLTLTLPRAASSQATSTTTNQFVPFALSVFVPCANDGLGETVQVSGTLHIQNHVTINQKHITLKTLFQPQGATGLGVITGDVYRGTGVTQFLDTIPNVNGATTFTFINNFRFIGPGPDNNLQIHQNVQSTINANGEITSVVNNTSIVCN